MVSVTSLTAFNYYGLYHGTESLELKSSSSYASHCTNTQREKGCSKNIHGRARGEGRDTDQESRFKVTKHIQGRVPNRSPLLRSDPWPPADEHFLLLDTPCSPLWCLLGGISRTWRVAGHRYGVGCSGRVTQGGAGASLSLGHRALRCNGVTTLVILPLLFPRANALLWGHSLPCRMSDSLFFCLTWLEAAFEGALERGSHHLMLGPGDGADPPLG